MIRWGSFPWRIAPAPLFVPPPSSSASPRFACLPDHPTRHTIPTQISRRLIDTLDGDTVSTSQRVDRVSGDPVGVTKNIPGKSVGGSAQQKQFRNLQTFAAMGAVGDADAVAEFRPMFPGLDNALARSLRVGELLLKSELAELDLVREKASEVQSKHHLMIRREAPCVAEREACRLCYTQNSENTLVCGNEVAAYDLCARAAQEAFVKRGAVATAA